ncbi:hypothetical protein Barb7_00556 [Bacteroidales bacterium Barb7]|nr:hypothetical protein Barb7_00556 [Bacteroidales bacterium Barb7]
MSQFDGRRQGNSDYLSNKKGARVCFVLRIINGKQSCFVLINFCGILDRVLDCVSPRQETADRENQAMCKTMPLRLP